MKEKRYFILFSNVHLTKGYKRCLLFDSVTGNYNFIPNDLYLILTELRSHTLEEIITKYGESNKDVILEYFSFLEDNKFGAFVSNYINFPMLSTQWDSPSKISNAIIDINSIPALENLNHLADLDQLGCKFVQIRIYNDIDLDLLAQKINTKTLNTDIFQIEIVLKYSKQADEKLISLFAEFTRILRVTFTEAPSGKTSYCKNNIEFYFTNICVDSEKCCGKISPKYFQFNMTHYMESQSYNTCLNRKISIDASGNIKNCPSMSESFGTIHDVSLVEVANNPSFQKKWLLSKDYIDDCKICEFRHVCTDCRAYTIDSRNELSKPLKCGYNPYTCEWDADAASALRFMAY